MHFHLKFITGNAIKEFFFFTVYLRNDIANERGNESLIFGLGFATINPLNTL